MFRESISEYIDSYTRERKYGDGGKGAAALNEWCLETWKLLERLEGICVDEIASDDSACADEYTFVNRVLASSPDLALLFHVIEWLQECESQRDHDTFSDDAYERILFSLRRGDLAAAKRVAWENALFPECAMLDGHVLFRRGASVGNVHRGAFMRACREWCRVNERGCSGSRVGVVAVLGACVEEFVDARGLFNRRKKGGDCDSELVRGCWEFQDALWARGIGLLESGIASRIAREGEGIEIRPYLLNASGSNCIEDAGVRERLLACGEKEMSGNALVRLQMLLITSSVLDFDGILSSDRDSSPVLITFLVQLIMYLGVEACSSWQPVVQRYILRNISTIPLADFTALARLFAADSADTLGSCLAAYIACHAKEADADTCALLKEAVGSGAVRAAVYACFTSAFEEGAHASCAVLLGWLLFCVDADEALLACLAVITQALLLDNSNNKKSVSSKNISKTLSSAFSIAQRIASSCTSLRLRKWLADLLNLHHAIQHPTSAAILYTPEAWLETGYENECADEGASRLLAYVAAKRQEIRERYLMDVIPIAYAHLLSSEGAQDGALGEYREFLWLIVQSGILHTSASSAKALAERLLENLFTISHACNTF